MAESLVHLRLVETIIAYVHDEYQRAYQLATFHDLPGLLGAEKPPRIGGYVPDFYALDAPQSIAILGEAKTENDLDTDHSRRQFIAFLTFLHSQPDGIFVLAVPWQARARARNLVRRLQRQLQCESLQTVVITAATG